MATPIPSRLALFHKKYGPKLKEFLQTECGEALLKELKSMEPKPLCDPIEHQAIYRHGSIAGHQQAQLDIFTLSDVRPDPQPAPKLNYGVKEEDDSDRLSEK